MVVLFITTIAIALVGGLAQQVMSMNKSSKQIAAIIEMRGRIAALSKDPDTFLNKMRSVIPPGSSVSLEACIPTVTNPGSTKYTCPNVLSDDELIAERISNEDTENGRYKVSKVPLYDPRGELIAPRYLTDTGAECTHSNPETKCPFMSEGFMFRENASSDGDPNPFPGSVKFVSRISMNPKFPKSGGTPMKAMFMSVDLGTGWRKSSTKVCPEFQVFQGINEDGSTKCVDPTSPCPSGEIQVGYLADGPICEDPSKLSCLTTEKPILDPVGKKLLCSSNSPCTDPGKSFTGFYAGSGEPICENPKNQCTAGSVQMGEKDGNPLCIAVVKCSAGEAISFNGSKFECTKVGREIANIGCDNGKILQGFDDKGEPVCVDAGSKVPAIHCPIGKYLSGIDADRKAICTCLPGTTESEKDANVCVSNFVGFSCPDGTYLKGYRDDRSPICEGEAPIAGIKTVTKTLTLESPILVASKVDKTYSLSTIFPEIHGKKILSVTLSNYGYQKYMSKTCNVTVDSISVSPANPTKTFSFYTISSKVILNASAQTINLVHAGTTKDGLSRACIEDATISIQYE